MAGEHIEMAGQVVGVQRGKFWVKLENGNEIIAQISGKIRQNKIQINLGDGVVVKVSPYDLQNGIIVYRK